MGRYMKYRYCTSNVRTINSSEQVSTMASPSPSPAKFFPSVPHLDPQFSSQSSIPLDSAGASPHSPSHPLYFSTIDDFYTSFIPCLCLVEVLQQKLGLTIEEESSKTKEDDQLCKFLDAFASLCDVVREGCSCTAVAIANESQNPVFYITANQIHYANEAKTFAHQIIERLQLLNYPDLVDEKVVVDQLTGIFSEYERDPAHFARARPSTGLINEFGMSAASIYALACYKLTTK